MFYNIYPSCYVTLACIFKERFDISDLSPVPSPQERGDVEMDNYPSLSPFVETWRAASLHLPLSCGEGVGGRGLFDTAKLKIKKPHDLRKIT